MITVPIQTAPMPPLPICDVCKKTVDKLVSVKDDFDDCLAFRVFCHGEVETVRVDIRDLREMTGQMYFGRAFVKAKQLVP
jgi:hypothetical protein